MWDQGKYYILLGGTKEAIKRYFASEEYKCNLASPSIIFSNAWRKISTKKFRVIVLRSAKMELSHRKLLKLLNCFAYFNQKTKS